MSKFKPLLASPVEFDKLNFANEIYQSPKLDGCFSGSTRVWTERGLMGISDIVDRQLRVKVASFNETTREVEFKPVVGWFDNGLKPASEWMSFGSKCKITKNHKVYGPNGWVEAGSAGDVGLRIDENLGAVITGMLLGDGCASVEKRYARGLSWRLIWSSCDADAEYGRAKARILENWVTCREKPFVSGFGHPQVNFVSSACTRLPYDLSRFYVLDPESEDYGRRKEDLDLCDIAEDFNDLSLAIWYFDDGSIQSNNGNDSTPRIHFSVARFSDVTLENVKRLFQTKYGFVPTIEKYGRDIKMSFSSAESVYLLWRIGRIAGSMMPRKMPAAITFGETKVAAGVDWRPSLVGKPLADGSTKVFRAYDIEVEGNHNYFADGQLVHNCRAVIINGVVMSRSLKPIPNQHVQRLFGHLEHYDGELIVDEPNAPDVYRKTASSVMSRDGEPNVKFYAFDHIRDPDADYITRFEQLEDQDGVVIVTQIGVRNIGDIETLEQRFLEQGYEGAMLRAGRGSNSKYKFGRATAKSNTLLKLKRMASDEAEIIDVIELEHNLNEATLDERGYTKRSTHQENKVGGGVMGAIVVRDIKDGCVFNIGTGFTAEDRKMFWDQRDAMVGRLVTYDHFPVGRKDLPRHPSWKGFRSVEDM